MVTFNDKLKAFSVELFKVQAIKFGEYKTKVGLMTPVYCDLRVIVSYPKLMETLAGLLIEYFGKIKNFDIICGVPYTALPIATAVSIKTSVPMVMRRKETKDYGTKKLIEGVYKEGDNCLIVEDVVTSGSSILETVKDLKGAGIECRDAVVLLNREQGGANILKENGITMHALLSLTELMRFLREADCIDNSIVEKVKNYLANTQVNPSVIQKSPSKNRLELSFLARAKLAKNPIAEELLQLMATKQTTLCVASDLTSSTDILNLAERVGPHICMLKTHIDIVEDFHPNLIKPLQEIAQRHNFILFEDRKFADIGKTVELQYSKGVYKISSWAKVVTAHSITGKGVLDAIKGSEGSDKRGVFLLAQVSASGNLIDESYTKATLKLAEEYPRLITGIVCQSPLALDNPGLVQLTPGVQLEAKGDNLGQQYNSPSSVVLERGADVAVVGRGVTKAADPGAAAEKYKKILWDAYSKRVNGN
ncbi:uridine 5'-monophosphate synthase [Anoplophora glabripennis]|uniref:uridine 5'-monophosphate synthase n=1 Tax=Anoplophora glabripennis TaxID=217634 RepID=UPI0008739B21|nr:uridine 5'-monophosphate synthase [Anoplophora glabripennis]